jgi:two-component system response regulator AtoC
VSTGDQKTELVSVVSATGRRLVANVDGNLMMFDLPQVGTVVLGRSSEADLVVDHPSISRKHASLECGDVIRVEDLGSANGTVVAGRKLSPGDNAPLVPGIVLELGSVLFTVREPSEQQVAKPASNMVVASPAMKEVLETVRVAASSRLSVLLLGETGVGKEVLARKIHELSNRAKGPLVRVNCAAFVESLLEAELFGYERGAFTGATNAKPGLLEAASGGTMFLDEIGELALATQAKLLRVLESGEVTRVGALKPRSVDVRFVAATHRDLRQLVAEGRFREDLFFRLDGVSIRIPSLRERTEEILPLAESFVSAFAEAEGRPAPHISGEAAQRLRAHGWSGNVRELRNVMQRTVLFGKGPEITLADLRLDPMGSAAPSRGAGVSVAPVAGSNVPPPARELSPERAERRQKVLDALEKTVWNQTRAAEILGISRRTLQTWMIDLDIPRPRTGPR